MDIAKYDIHIESTRECFLWLFQEIKIKKQVEIKDIFNATVNSMISLYFYIKNTNNPQNLPAILHYNYIFNF